MIRRPLPTILVAALILTAVLLPGSSLPEGPGIPGFDKLVHFLMFAALAVAMHLDFDLTGTLRVAPALAAAVAFSGLTELLQIFVDGRSSEMLDMAADMAGYCAGVLVRGPASSLCRKALAALRKPFSGS